MFFRVVFHWNDLNRRQQLADFDYSYIFAVVFFFANFRQQMPLEQCSSVECHIRGSLGDMGHISPKEIFLLETPWENPPESTFFSTKTFAWPAGSQPDTFEGRKVSSGSEGEERVIMWG